MSLILQDFVGNSWDFGPHLSTRYILINTGLIDGEEIDQWFNLSGKIGKGKIHITAKLVPKGAVEGEKIVDNSHRRLNKLDISGKYFN